MVVSTAAAATGHDNLPRSTTGTSRRPSTRPATGEAAVLKWCAPRRSRTSPADATGSRGSAGSAGSHPGRRSTGSTPTSSASTPTRNPPNRAPRTWLKPPMIAAVKANRPRAMPPSHRTLVVGDTSRAATTTSTALITNVYRTIRPTGMPRTFAVDGLCAAASICRPVEVRRRNSCRARITIVLTTRIPTSSAEMAIPRGRHTSVPNTEGNCCGVAPNSTRRYSRMTRASPMVAMTSGMSSPPGVSRRSTSDTLKR